jgi:two-component system, OmpR family, sensor kinase
VSLRGRLLVGLGLVAAVLICVAVFVSRASQSYLVDQVDDRLPGRSSPTAHGPSPEGGPDGDSAPRSFSPYYLGTVDGDTVQTVQMPDVVDGEQNDADVPEPDIDADQARRAAEPGSDPFFTVGSSDPDVRYRVRVSRDDDGGVEVVGTSLEDVDATVSRLVVVEAVATALVLGILGLVAFWVLRLGVRPLKSMTRTATAIAGGGDLARRVPDAPAGTEAGELGTALNTMLGRIEDSFAQQQASEDRLRRFVADASHELRTPVTTIRGYAELHRRGALDDPAELAQAMRRTEAEARRMADLVDDLLLLARLDQGRPLERRAVDLGVLAIDAAGDARAVAPERTVRATTQEGVVVEGDEHRLRQVIANLVRNALVHTPATATITVAARREGERAVVEVADDGPGMASDQAGRAFERFYRADPGRARDRGGSGLGLSIVQAVALAHGGSATLASAPGEGTDVRVELPLAPGVPGSVGAR